MSDLELFGTILGIMFGTLVVMVAIGAVFLNLFDRIDDEQPDEEI